MNEKIDASNAVMTVKVMCVESWETAMLGMSDSPLEVEFPVSVGWEPSAPTVTTFG